MAIPGLSLLVPSQFQVVPSSSFLMFYQQYINNYNKLMLIIYADQDSETDYGLKWYYNTESRAGTKEILNLWRKGLLNVAKSIK